MSKPTAIILLVLLALLLFGIFKILLPSIKIYISRMPKGIFVLLFLVIVCVIIYLVYYLIGDPTGGNPGNDKQTAASSGETAIDEERPIKEDCIILSGSDVFIENKKADSETIEKYIDYRVENNRQITIVDDYSTAALIHEIKALCDEKGIRYVIEDEKWLE